MEEGAKPIKTTKNKKRGCNTTSFFDYFFAISSKSSVWRATFA
jgi:hypothetical protein